MIEMIYMIKMDLLICFDYTALFAMFILVYNGVSTYMDM